MDGTMTTIILAIIIIVLIYILYVYFVSKSKTLASSASLKGTNPAITDISSGQSTRYAYSIWLYVNSWDTTVNKPIISRKGDVNLWLDTQSSTLKLNVGGDHSSYNGTIQSIPSSDTTGNTQQIYDITNNFPLQKVL